MLKNAQTYEIMILGRGRDRNVADPRQAVGTCLRDKLKALDTSWVTMRSKMRSGARISPTRRNLFDETSSLWSTTR
jgi:hypothetical protein